MRIKVIIILNLNFLTIMSAPSDHKSEPDIATIIYMRNRLKTCKEDCAFGVTCKEFEEAGVTIANLIERSFSLEYLRKAGYKVKDIRVCRILGPAFKAVGFNPQEMHEGGYSVDKLIQFGFSCKKFADCQFSITPLKPHYSLISFIKAGYPLEVIREAGYEDDDIKQVEEEIVSLRKTAEAIKEEEMRRERETEQEERKKLQQQALFRIRQEDAANSTGPQIPETKEHLTILELPTNRLISEKDIKAAFKMLALIHHPDKIGGDTEKFKKISNAYDYFGITG